MAKGKMNQVAHPRLMISGGMGVGKWGREGGRERANILHVIVINPELAGCVSAVRGGYRI